MAFGAVTFWQNKNVERICNWSFCGLRMNCLVFNCVSETLSNNAIWWHYLMIHIPNTIVHTDAALLYISHGNNNDGYEDHTYQHTSIAL